MKERVRTTANERPATAAPVHAGMEGLVGYILLSGVLVSMALLVVGLAWSWILTGHLGLTYSLAGTNLFEFVVTDLRQIVADPTQPRHLINLGIAALLLTPYARVLVSMLYFAFAERNGKYTLFTFFVFSVRTYGLFLR